MTSNQGQSGTTCVECKSFIPVGSQFCPNCGRAIGTPLRQTRRSLRQSGEPTAPGYGRPPDPGWGPETADSRLQSTGVEPADPWPRIVADGIREISSTISDTVDGVQKDRTQIQLARLSLDRLVIGVFSIAFLGAIGFSFYLILIDKTGPIGEFVFPIITASLGLIGGYIAGRGAAAR